MQKNEVKAAYKVYKKRIKKAKVKFPLLTWHTFKHLYNKKTTSY